MMKKFSTLFTVAIASSAMMLNAQSLTETQTLWAKFVTNSEAAQSNTSQGNQMVLAQDGGLFAMGQAGSSNNGQNILFGEDQVATGINYGGNSANQGLLLMKLDPSGNPEWTLAQTNGEVINNENRVAATADGGAVMFVNMRHTEGHLGENIVIRDGLGMDHDIDWAIDSERSCRGYVIKVSPEGAIEWMRALEMNTTADEATYPSWTQTSRHIGQGLKTNALDVDNDGNIFVGGLMCATMSIGDVTITPHNVNNWNGKASTTAGNLYIIKLDAQGNYVDHLVTEGAATNEGVQSLKVVGNKLYVFAWVAGLAGTEFSLGGKAATPTTINGSLCLAQLDTDLNVDWLNFCESTVSGSAWQMPTMTVAGSHIYLMGTAKYGLRMGDATITNTPANQARQSWLVQFNAADGELVNANVLANNQHGFFGAYEGTDGHLYTIERGLNASFGSQLTLYKYDQQSLTIGDQVQLASGSCDGQSLVTNGNLIYVMNRFVNKNEVCTFLGSDITHQNPAFCWGQSAYQVPVGAVSGINMSMESLDIDLGNSAEVEATVIPENVANADIIWSSSDESVVTVENGVITAVASDAPQGLRRAAGDVLGSAVVTATSASNPNVKKSIAVNVTEPFITGVTDVKKQAVDTTRNDVYTIDGRLVRRASASVDGLPAGLYIVGGKKVVIK